MSINKVLNITSLTKYIFSYLHTHELNTKFIVLQKFRLCIYTIHLYINSLNNLKKAIKFIEAHPNIDVYIHLNSCVYILYELRIILNYGLDHHGKMYKILDSLLQINRSLKRINSLEFNLSKNYYYEPSKYIKYFLEVYKFVEYITILKFSYANCNIPENFSNLCNMINNLKMLEDIDISYDMIGNERFTELFDVLENLPNLKKVKCHGNGFSSENIQLLVVKGWSVFI